MSTFDVKQIGKLQEPSRRPGGVDSPCQACTVRHLTLCAALEEQELAEMSAIVATLELAPGDPLFYESEPAQHVFNVTAGAVRVYKLLSDGRRQMTGFLFAGDFLGLANDDSYAYSAEAITHATLCRFPRRKLELLLERYPRMEHRLLGMASHELAAAQEQMLLLGRKTAREKVASFLLMLSRRAVKRGLKDSPIAIPMGRNDIGDYLGLTTETVSRTFTQLKRNGCIRLAAGNKIELVHRDRLESIAEGG
ncbi:MAG TPA: cyclic nucleotide-binding domain-containing protein [Kiloniellales bacterium]|nr:cyclic nucleotide-binding domain-containing protein [Kiloniellales bacterium]